MTANLVSDDLQESITDGFIRLDLVRTYQVITDDRADSSFVARNTAGVPRIGSKVNTTTGETLWVTNVRPRRVSEETGRKWFVDVTMTNGTGDFPRDVNGNPVIDPTLAVSDVDISYVEYQEDVTRARLLSITKEGPRGVGTVTTVPNWLQPMQATAYRGPIVNSAAVPQDAQKSSFRRVITVSKWVATWDTSDDAFIGFVNSDTVTLTQSDGQGTKLTLTLDPETLLLQDIVKEDHWKDGILYFRKRFVLAENVDSWVYPQLDEGTKRRIEIGMYKPDGTLYAQADLDAAGIEGSWGYQEITTDNGAVAIGEPVRFNGWGQDAPIEQAAGYDDKLAHYLNWDIYGLKAFAPLGL